LTFWQEFVIIVVKDERRLTFNERNMLENAVEVVGNFDATMDSLYVIKEGAFGFLTEAKESPYPWMFAASVAAGALPLALVFFGVLSIGG